MAKNKPGEASTSTGSTGGSTSSRLRSRQGTSTRRRVEWSDCDTEQLARFITRATNSGALVSFSRTSDGGALHLRVMEGDDVAKEYASSEDDLMALIQEFDDLYA